MNAKHTPGPWIANDYMVNAEAGTICGPVGGSYYAKRDELAANARLIAAAPDLLKIAQAYRNHLRTAAHTEGQVATFEHISEVIAKATGQQ